MRNIFTITLLSLMLARVGRADAFPSHQWSHSYGGPDAQYASNVVCDAAGNVLVTGGFRQTLDLGGGPLTSLSSTDMWFAKFDENGTHLWSKRIDDSGGSFGPTYLATTSTGDLVATGDFRGTLNFGGGPLTSVGPGDDIFVVKFDANGNHLWSARYGDASDQWPDAIAIDENDDIVVGADGLGPTDFGGGLLAGSGKRMFLVKFNTAGGHVWSKQFGVGNAVHPRGVAIDPSGSIAVAGILDGTVDFGGGPLVKDGFPDVFVVSFDSNGNHRWSGRYGNSSEQWGAAVVANADGSIIVTGSFYESIDLGGGAFTSAGEDDIFLVKFASDGSHVWSRSFGNVSPQHPRDIRLDEAGNVVLSGWNKGTLQLGNGFMVMGDTMTDHNSFLAEFDPAGSPRWSTSFIGRNESSCGLALGPNRRMTICGSFEFVIDFGGAPLQSVASSDVFLAGFEDDQTTPVGSTGTIATLHQNFPNPFNPTTSIAYTVSQRASVVIAIFDATGARVAHLDQGSRDPGDYVVAWNGRDDAGRTAASGVYFYRLEGVAGVAPKKMVLLK